MRRRAVLATTLVLSLAACEFDERVIGAGRSRPVVHAVLDPSFTTATYVVLVERTLTGQLDTRSVRDPDDPIASGGGIPISEARVELVNLAGGPTAVGIEDLATREDGKGAGVYRFRNESCAPLGCAPNAMPIARGARYRLRVTLPGGTEVLEAETTVPIAQQALDTLLARPFDAERDTMRLSWPRAERAHRYALQVQTPYGPYQLFSADTMITLSGGLRNVLGDRVPLVFTPGFRQAVQIAAVDTNYYDYYRSGNDPFTGSGILTHVRGGTGLFGSYAPIRTSAFEVRAPQEEPIEGNFVGGTDRFEIYVIGPGLVSGRYNRTSEFRFGVLGTRSGNRMRLAVLRGQRASDTLFLADAEVVADTLIIRRSGEVFQRFFRLK